MKFRSWCKKTDMGVFIIYLVENQQFNFNSPAGVVVTVLWKKELEISCKEFFW